MKVFISADIEGNATTTTHDDCRSTNPAYPYHAEQMTSEVVAACEGAIAAGADDIVIKDAHGPANNIDVKRLPKCARIIRNWSYHPFRMVEGLDDTFDACMFVGYHSAASSAGSPLSHTCTGKPAMIKINGMICSEFDLFSTCATYNGVPSVYLSGDKGLCDHAEGLHYPALVTTSVKEGCGSSTISLQPVYACELIRRDSERALRQDFSGKLPALPDRFDVEICYSHHSMANQFCYYPGAERTGDLTIAYSHTDYFEILRFLRFVL